MPIGKQEGRFKIWLDFDFRMERGFEGLMMFFEVLCLENVDKAMNNNDEYCRPGLFPYHRKCRVLNGPKRSLGGAHDGTKVSQSVTRRPTDTHLVLGTGIRKALCRYSRGILAVLVGCHLSSGSPGSIHKTVHVFFLFFPDVLLIARRRRNANIIWVM